MNDFKSFVVVMVCSVFTHGVSAQYPGYFGYQQPSQGYFPPAPVFYQPRPTLRYDIGLGQSPPQHYYSPPDNTYRGFSYETRYQDGASSHVVYVTGPQSQELMQRSFAVFRNVLPVAVSPPTQASATVLPALTPTIITTTNSTSAPVIPISRSAPTVNIFPPQFIPAYNLPRFIPPPFPYRSFMTPFNAIPPQLQSNPPASGTSSMTAEPASEVQESMIREVAAPAAISSRIDVSDNQEAETETEAATTAVETSSVSTESTQAAIEVTSPGEPAESITTAAQAPTESSETELPQATEPVETISANDPEDSTAVTDALESEASTGSSEIETTPRETTTEA